jgi:hypothetical protein
VHPYTRMSRPVGVYADRWECIPAEDGPFSSASHERPVGCWCYRLLTCAPQVVPEFEMPGHALGFLPVGTNHYYSSVLYHHSITTIIILLLLIIILFYFIWVNLPT